MDKDFSELIEYLDKKFEGIEQDIKNLQEGQGKLQVAVLDNSGKIDNLQVKVLDNSGKIDNIGEKMATKTEVNKLLDAVDAYMKQGEDYRQEVVMLGNQVNRHEKWIQKIAEKLDLKLEH
jgi:peptidoglycan hydrolase CwlO-like protein